MTDYSFDGKYNFHKYNDWLTNFEMEELKEKSLRTIGGHISSSAHN